MKKWFADVTKFAAIIIIAAIAFYVACPKYSFEFFQTEAGEEIVRMNSITGEITHIPEIKNSAETAR